MAHRQNMDLTTLHGNQFYTIKEIADWQLSSDSNVLLPKLQRSFVWKPSQIEALWDSLLRGFPIGSFLFSSTTTSSLLLLDGQQRATSISLGYYDPWFSDNNEFWSIKNNIPIIWIDLNPKEKTITQKFVFRVVTQPHPWGYQRRINNTILSVSDRRAALLRFKEIESNKHKSYIEFDLTKVFPFDANLPVPLTFLLRAVSEDILWKASLIRRCEENLHYESLKTKFPFEMSYMDDLKKYLNTVEADLLHTAVKKLDNLKIPAITIDRETLLTDEEFTSEQQDPTLFVRLNASGTRLEGEELIYSIYKAYFPDSKQLVEKVGANFIAPSQVINYAVRIVQADLNQSYPNTLNVNEFRRRLGDEKFVNALKSLIGDINSSPIAKLFSQATSILLANKIPPILAKKLIKASPDLFLLLLYWLRNNVGDINLSTQEKILRFYTAVSWFCPDSKKFVRQVWSRSLKFDFWSKKTIATNYINKSREVIFFPLIQPEMLKKYLLKAVVTDNLKWEDLTPSDNSKIMRIYSQEIRKFPLHPNEILNAKRNAWNTFIGKLLWNRSLILFAQREYLSQRFKEFNQMEDFEDTHAPWDWDHIYPQSWVYRKRHIHYNARFWTNTIGNIRALSLEENRSDGNSYSPSQRLLEKEVRTLSFVNEEWVYWKQISQEVYEKDEQLVKVMLKAIICRVCSIYGEWYKRMNVGEIFSHSI